jgi:type IV secretory pathway VirB10-like protein
MAARPVLLAVLCLGMSGCLFWKKAAPKIPAPVPAAQPVAAQAAPPPVAQNATPAATPMPVPTPKETPTPKPTVRSNPVPAPPPPAPTATPVAPVAPPPPLREIISGEQRRQYESEFSKGVARASAALKQASTRTLNASQQETAARVRTFLAQAKAMQDNDISTALQLARRADLLGQELLKSLK